MKRSLFMRSLKYSQFSGSGVCHFEENGFHFLTQWVWSDGLLGPALEQPLATLVQPIQMAISVWCSWTAPTAGRPGLKNRHLGKPEHLGKPMEQPRPTTLAIWMARASRPGVLPCGSGYLPSGCPLLNSNHMWGGVSGHSCSNGPGLFFFGCCWCAPVASIWLQLE